MHKTGTIGPEEVYRQTDSNHLDESNVAPVTMLACSSTNGLMINLITKRIASEHIYDYGCLSRPKHQHKPTATYPQNER